MRRLIPYLIGLASLSALIALAVSPGCGNECNNALDCKPGNICYRNICTPTSATYVHCSTSHDCGGSGEFVCSSGRCVLGATTPPAGTMDAASTDLGPDTGILPDAGPDTGTMDALGMDALATDTSTRADANMDALTTDTSTIADAAAPLG
jgi:hypothetical protein